MAHRELEQLSRSDLLQAMERFDEDLRHRDDWIGWEEDGNYKYAVEHDGRWYPVKEVIHLATGLPKDQYSGGDHANGIVEQFDFVVKDLPDPDRDPLAARLRFILHRYPLVEHQGSFGATHPVWERFESVADDLARTDFIAGSPDLAVEWSVGKGNWARIPWVAVLDHRITKSLGEGIYAVYLFRENMSGVCLCLIQGVTSVIEARGRTEGRDWLRERAAVLRPEFESLTSHGFEFDDLDLETDHPLGLDYEAAAIAHKDYTATDLPTDDVLLSDLSALLGSCEEYVHAHEPLESLDTDALAELREKFERRLPDFEGCREQSGLYWNWERGYKEELRQEFEASLVPQLRDGGEGTEWAASLRESVHDLLTTRLDLADGRQQNLISWRYYTFLRDLSESETLTFSEAFLDLLRGEGTSGERVARFNRVMAPVLESRDSGGDAVTRSFPTLFLMLDDPDNEIFIRTSLFNRLGSMLLGEELFEHQPLGRAGYERARRFARAIRQHMEAWGWKPADMIDVQSFMWVAGARSVQEPSHWIFQYNPDFYDVESEIRDHDRITWSMNQHADDIELGDRIYLWESGQDAGIVGLAIVVDGPQEMPQEDFEASYVTDAPDRFEGVRTRVRLYIERVLGDRVLREDLMDDPSLEGLTILQNAQGTNFPVSREHAELIDAYVDGLEPGEVEKTILKVAPGRKGIHWDDCVRDGVILVGWNDLGDLRDFDTLGDLRKAVEEHYGDSMKGHDATISRTANRLWDFRNLGPGDVIVANRGTSEVLGIGTVQKPGYRWSPEREGYRHAVSVNWDETLSGGVVDQGGAWRPTIVELHEEEYSELLEELIGEPGFQGLLEDLVAKGFYFPTETVANYLLALQTKRFVILTGISGTGKTRLAIETAKHFRPVVETERLDESPDESLEVEVYPYMIKYGQMVVPVALSSRLRVFDEGSERSTEVEVVYPEGTTELTLSREPDRNVTYLNFRGEFRRWFSETFQPGDPLFLDLEPTESGGQRFILRRPRTRRERTRLDNYEVVDVHPDWTDNRGLLGYYNPITEQYRPTPFLNLLLRASDEEERAEKQGRTPHPFFVILDEMNLARVEHYFSDFLSALESEEAIHLHDDPALEAGNVEEGSAIPRRLDIPGNVFFTGTVNMDETTYMFSPKVLDRAFTLELNRVDLRGYGDLESPDMPAGALVIDRLSTPLISERRPNTEDWRDFGNLLDGDLQQTVVELNELLAKDNLHFGYRVANEIARFVLLAVEQAEDAARTARSALDVAVMEKVLPKFHGTEQELGGVLRSLLRFTVTGEPKGTSDSEADRELTDVDWIVQRGRLIAPEGDEEIAEPILPRTAAKLWRMLRRLRDQGFTSFIQ